MKMNGRLGFELSNSLINCVAAAACGDSFFKKTLGSVAYLQLAKQYLLRLVFSLFLPFIQLDS